jgi:hypothetical protein
MNSLHNEKSTFDDLKFDFIQEKERDDLEDKTAVKIIINGVPLHDLLRPIELPYCEEEGWPHGAGYYCYLPPHELYDILTEAVVADSYHQKYGANLNCCQYGEWGCWSVHTYISEMEDVVIWQDFGHEHRHAWKYPFRFVFDRKGYWEQVELLNEV